jgi:septal ring factor EnvC (AmiA/AmiB activator)
MSDPAARAEISQFERLEALVRELIERHRALATERAELRERLAQRDARLKSLDAQLVESNQTRRDAAKRVDELIAQLERVQAEVERRLSAATTAAPE